uniref:ATP-dependent Clp protease proteolytic subunit n=1 Tax=Timspurckia oligopyrenoides TaxID=708627 RepID=A0A7S1ERY9_9RHOD|mmetsp:Transcript_3094/g.5450  ORF Transcript_3094/g.5450 Transcript_3094/m.5450 type:complete len:266 (+) Transcript_3094:63-860(+)
MSVVMERLDIAFIGSFSRVTGGNRLLSLSQNQIKCNKSTGIQSRHAVVRKSCSIQMGGTPRVPYKAPGQQEYQFMDVFERLARDRIMFVGQDIDDETANQMIATLLFLESEDANSPVTIYFNSAGATTNAGFAVYDCLQSMKFPICTLNLGLAASMSAFLCAVGTKGSRLALPNARFLIQAPSLPDGIQGQAEDIAIEVRHTLSMRDKYALGLHKSTGRSLEKIMEDLKRDFYLTAYEAREYGLIDKVLQPKDAVETPSYAGGIG